jgi:hypothetical protein
VEDVVCFARAPADAGVSEPARDLECLAGIVRCRVSDRQPIHRNDATASGCARDTTSVSESFSRMRYDILDHVTSSPGPRRKLRPDFLPGQQIDEVVLRLRGRRARTEERATA